MTLSIDTAMVLAAGLGRRMRPLTDTMPKPMVPVLGKPLIDYALDRFACGGIDNAIVNVHYFADQIEQHLEARESPAIRISDERGELLETGGALLKALPLLESDKPFFCTNTDAILLDVDEEACASLVAAWRDNEMDALLLLCPVARASGYDGNGDFIMGEDGRLVWPDASASAGQKKVLVFTGLQILHPRLFQDEPLRCVSTKAFWDKAMAQGRLFGCPYDGWWMHVGDPQGVKQAEELLQSAEQGQMNDR
ncbi:nucleotidyltransferase family protein [Parvularcula sp. IMCC14364]|uniref:nucleotidyltransferase family protein n=1 Tax=Parvularcula sp. IMCC14364 TaxID=3067902 RepID=UPI0027424521|nr:nucleotidyltransferase family protein [Parvularcula sp. IMCC14364]